MGMPLSAFPHEEDETQSSPHELKETDTSRVVNIGVHAQIQSDETHRNQCRFDL